MLTIVALLLSTLMYTLAAHTDQRGRDETASRLEAAKELLLGFAVTHGRLPCPASAASNGDESPAGGGPCNNYLDGFLPATAIGFRPVDASGYALDAWGNRIRYALARNATEPSTSSATCATPLDHAFASTANLKTNSIGCAPANIVICDATQNTNTAITPPSCGTWSATGDARVVTNQRTVAAVIFATGKNTLPGCSAANCPHEAENTDGTDGLFVWHEQRPSDGTGGEYDDQMVWIPVGLLYGRMIAAGVLP